MPTQPQSVPSLSIEELRCRDNVRDVLTIWVDRLNAKEAAEAVTLEQKNRAEYHRRFGRRNVPATDAGIAAALMVGRAAQKAVA